MINKWCLSQDNQWNSTRLIKAGISQSIIHILKNRGYDSVNSILKFLRPSLFDFHSPFLFKDMQTVIDRLEKALQSQEKILVYGDYDVDGVSGTAVIYKVLKQFGFNTIVHVPSREEGYGLHQEVITKASNQQVSLIITVDCGITAVEETALATTLGVDIIITDHHEPPKQLPLAVGILNPKIADSGYPFQHLAGVGVAFKLVQALFRHFDYPVQKVGSELDYLDLVALGTIADIVPLIGENRIIAKYGLQVMENTKHTGVKAMLEECGMKGKKLKAGQISFIVAPRINAAGRMDTARLAINLLLEEDSQDALDIAKELSKENALRQSTERQILQEAEDMLADKHLPEVIVLSSPHWHHGVIGIVASRLVERFHRPVFLICEEGEMGKGSARGISGYHVLEELVKQSSLLAKYGGHKQAAGFTISVANIEAFSKALIQSCIQTQQVFEEQLFIDSIIPCSDLNIELQKELEEMAPFGAGNPAPILMTENLKIKRITKIGRGGEHLKMILQQDHFTLEVLAFKRSEELEKIREMKTIDVIYTLEINDYFGEERIQAILKDYRQSTGDSISQVACVQELHSNEEKQLCLAAQDDGLVLTRRSMVEQYKRLRDQANENDEIYWHPDQDKESQIAILKIFEELGLAQWRGGTGPFLIQLNSDNRADLQHSLRYRMLSQGQKKSSEAN